MPCADSNVDDWESHASAMRREQKANESIRALFCGVLRGDKKAIALADEWFVIHKKHDEAKNNGKYYEQCNAEVEEERFLVKHYGEI